METQTYRISLPWLVLYCCTCVTMAFVDAPGCRLPDLLPDLQAQLEPTSYLNRRTNCLRIHAELIWECRCSLHGDSVRATSSTAFSAESQRKGSSFTVEFLVLTGSYTSLHGLGREMVVLHLHR